MPGFKEPEETTRAIQDTMQHARMITPKVSLPPAARSQQEVNNATRAANELIRQSKPIRNYTMMARSLQMTSDLFKTEIAKLTGEPKREMQQIYYLWKQRAKAVRENMRNGIKGSADAASMLAATGTFAATSFTKTNELNAKIPEVNRDVLGHSSNKALITGAIQNAASEMALMRKSLVQYLKKPNSQSFNSLNDSINRYNQEAGKALAYYGAALEFQSRHKAVVQNLNNLRNEMVESMSQTTALGQRGDMHLDEAEKIHNQLNWLYSSSDPGLRIKNMEQRLEKYRLNDAVIERKGMLALNPKYTEGLNANERFVKNKTNMLFAISWQTKLTQAVNEYYQSGWDPKKQAEVRTRLNNIIKAGKSLLREEIRNVPRFVEDPEKPGGTSYMFSKEKVDQMQQAKKTALAKLEKLESIIGNRGSYQQAENSVLEVSRYNYLADEQITKTFSSEMESHFDKRTWWDKYGDLTADVAVIGLGVLGSVVSGGTASPLVFAAEAAYFAGRGSVDMMGRYMMTKQVPGTLEALSMAAMVAAPGARAAKGIIALRNAGTFSKELSIALRSAPHIRNRAMAELALQETKSLQFINLTSNISGKFLLGSATLGVAMDPSMDNLLHNAVFFAMGAAHGITGKMNAKTLARVKEANSAMEVHLLTKRKVHLLTPEMQKPVLLTPEMRKRARPPPIPEAAKETVVRPIEIPKEAVRTSARPPPIPEAAKETVVRPIEIPREAERTSMRPPPIPEAAKQTVVRPIEIPKAAERTRAQPPPIPESATAGTRATKVERTPKAQQSQTEATNAATPGAKARGPAREQRPTAPVGRVAEPVMPELKKPLSERFGEPEYKKAYDAYRIHLGPKFTKTGQPIPGTELGGRGLGISPLSVSLESYMSLKSQGLTTKTYPEYMKDYASALREGSHKGSFESFVRKAEGLPQMVTPITQVTRRVGKSAKGGTEVTRKEGISQRQTQTEITRAAKPKPDISTADTVARDISGIATAKTVLAPSEPRIRAATSKPGSTIGQRFEDAINKINDGLPKEKRLPAESYTQAYAAYRLHLGPKFEKGKPIKGTALGGKGLKISILSESLESYVKLRYEGIISKSYTQAIKEYASALRSGSFKGSFEAFFRQTTKVTKQQVILGGKATTVVTAAVKGAGKGAREAMRKASGTLYSGPGIIYDVIKGAIVGGYREVKAARTALRETSVPRGEMLSAFRKSNWKEGETRYIWTFAEKGKAGAMPLNVASLPKLKIGGKEYYVLDQPIMGSIEYTRKGLTLERVEQAPRVAPVAQAPAQQIKPVQKTAFQPETLEPRSADQMTQHFVFDGDIRHLARVRKPGDVIPPGMSQQQVIMIDNAPKITLSNGSQRAVLSREIPGFSEPFQRKGGSLTKLQEVPKPGPAVTAVAGEIKSKTTQPTPQELHSAEVAFKRAEDGLKNSGIDPKSGANLESKIEAAYAVVRGETSPGQSGITPKQKAALLTYENARRKLAKITGQKIGEIGARAEEVTVKTKLPEQVKQNVKTSAQTETATGTIERKIDVGATAKELQAAASEYQRLGGDPANSVKVLAESFDAKETPRAQRTDRMNAAIKLEALQRKMAEAGAELKKPETAKPPSQVRPEEFNPAQFERMAGTIAGRPELEAVLKNVTDKNVRRVARVLDGLRKEKLESIPETYQSAISKLSGMSDPVKIIKEAENVLQKRRLKKD